MDGPKLALPKAVTLRAQLRRALGSDAEALAWVKAHPEDVDRMLADAIFDATAVALSDVTGFTADQVRAMQGDGLPVYGANVDPANPKPKDERSMLRLRRYFFPGKDVRGDDGKVRKVRYDPVLVIERRRQWWGKVQTKVGQRIGPTGKIVPIWDFAPGWESARSTEWLHPDGTWAHWTPSRTIEGVRSDGTTYTYEVQGEEQLSGHVRVDIPCDERCVSATGRKCECSCGGVNHGAGAQEVVIPFTGAELLSIALRR